MSFQQERMIQTYGPEGIFEEGAWKFDSDKLFGPKEAVAVWGVLSDYGIVPPASEDLVFVSPTANIPTHEIAIWQEDSKIRKGSSLFLAGDILSLNPSKLLQSTAPVSPSRRFHYFQWDAEALPLNPGSVDVLWDRKGLVWHASQRGNREELLDIFRSYHKLLKKNGAVILDNIQFSVYQNSLNPLQTFQSFVRDGLTPLKIIKRPSDLFPGKPFGQYEHSTVDLISEFGLSFRREVESLFAIYNVGSGILRTKALVRR